MVRQLDGFEIEKIKYFSSFSRCIYVSMCQKLSLLWMAVFIYWLLEINSLSPLYQVSIEIKWKKVEIKLIKNKIGMYDIYRNLKLWVGFIREWKPLGDVRKQLLKLKSLKFVQIT